jgi:hypothetical protein
MVKRKGISWQRTRPGVYFYANWYLVRSEDPDAGLKWMLGYQDERGQSQHVEDFRTINQARIAADRIIP